MLIVDLAAFTNSDYSTVFLFQFLIVILLVSEIVRQSWLVATRELH